MNAPAGQMHYAPPTTINPAVACIAGMTAQEAGNMDEAVLQFEHALLLAPALVDVRLLLAYALGAHGRNSDAHQVLDETPALETLPESDLRRLADAAAHLGATAIALKTVRVLAAANQNDADLQSMLGALLHRSGAVEEAGAALADARGNTDEHCTTARCRRALRWCASQL